MLKGTKKYWVIAVICGILSAVLMYQYIQGVKVRYEPDDLITVIKAAENIQKDTIITDAQIKTEKVPAKFTHPDTVTEKSMVLGKIALSEIIAGEYILAGKLQSSSDRTNKLSYAIPVSKRAVSIPIDNISGVSGFIRDGDRVDIIATLDIDQSSYSIFTLQDIEVLAVGVDGAQNCKETLTLAISPYEAQRLVMASERGSLRLMLRSPVDETKVNLPAYEIRHLLQNQ